MTAVSPSRESAVPFPKCAGPVASVGTNLAPCCVHVVPVRVKIHAAPAPLLSLCPPINAVLPSAVIDTQKPCWAGPTKPVPTSLGPCCVHVVPLRTNTHVAPKFVLSL